MYLPKMYVFKEGELYFIYVCTPELIYSETIPAAEIACGYRPEDLVWLLALKAIRAIPSSARG